MTLLSGSEINKINSAIPALPKCDYIITVDFVFELLWDIDSEHLFITNCYFFKINHPTCEQLSFANLKVYVN